MIETEGQPAERVLYTHTPHLHWARVEASQRQEFVLYNVDATSLDILIRTTQNNQQASLRLAIDIADGEYRITINEKPLLLPPFHNQSYSTAQCTPEEFTQVRNIINELSIISKFQFLSSVTRKYITLFSEILPTEFFKIVNREVIRQQTQPLVESVLKALIGSETYKRFLLVTPSVIVQSLEDIEIFWTLAFPHRINLFPERKFSTATLGMDTGTQSLYIQYRGNNKTLRLTIYFDQEYHLVRETKVSFDSQNGGSSRVSITFDANGVVSKINDVTLPKTNKKLLESIRKLYYTNALKLMHLLGLNTSEVSADIQIALHPTLRQWILHNPRIVTTVQN